MNHETRHHRHVRSCLGAILACYLQTCLFGLPGGSAQPAPPPNIVLIMADDMGYECVGANGSSSYRTPQLDRLAAGGLRFDHCYSQPICTPSRVQIMTGRYNSRNYQRFGILDASATTFAQVLKKAGYATCVAGKWQLEGGPRAPQHFGFDEHCLWQLTLRGKTITSRYPNPGLEENGKVRRFEGGEYGPDVVSDYICGFVRRQRERPFFVYYPMILPHWPFEPTPDSKEWDPKAPGLRRGGEARFFADMVAYTDKCVGKIVKTLEELELRDRTLVIFTGDNGTARSVTSRLGDRVVVGGKGLLTDAGTRVPLIANWPGTIAAGRVCDDLVDFTDMFPTLCDLSGAVRPQGVELDGVSFAPQLRGQAGTPRQWIYCWYYRNGKPEKSGGEWARTKRYKLHVDGRLFDVAADPLEQRPLVVAEDDSVLQEIRRRLADVLRRYERPGFRPRAQERR